MKRTSPRSPPRRHAALAGPFDQPYAIITTDTKPAAIHLRR
jgi:hypothetical protein